MHGAHRSSPAWRAARPLLRMGHEPALSTTGGGRVARRPSKLAARPRGAGARPTLPPLGRDACHHPPATNPRARVHRCRSARTQPCSTSWLSSRLSCPDSYQRPVARSAVGAAASGCHRRRPSPGLHCAARKQSQRAFEMTLHGVHRHLQCPSNLHGIQVLLVPETITARAAGGELLEQTTQAPPRASGPHRPNRSPSRRRRAAWPRTCARGRKRSMARCMSPGAARTTDGPPTPGGRGCDTAAGTLPAPDPRPGVGSDSMRSARPVHRALMHPNQRAEGRRVPGGGPGQQRATRTRLICAHMMPVGPGVSARRSRAS